MKNKVSFKVLIKYIIIMILILAISGFGFYKVFNSLNYGLDLKGGFEILYKVDSIDGSDVTEDMVTNTYKTISKRIDGLGLTEPNIEIEGTDRIRIQLAGVKDSDSARSTLSQVANLTFRDTKDNLIMNSDVLEAGGAYYQYDNLKHTVVLKIKDIDKFFKETEKIRTSDDPVMVIWLDYSYMKDSYTKDKEKCGTSESHCLSAATISTQLTGQYVTITGNFTEDEAKELVNQINSGSLPTKLTEISSKTVTASFGGNSLNKTLIAGAIGLLLVVVFMISTYRVSGLVASVSLILYTFISFFIFWLVGGTLTLPGIAAMLLGIGMAVDSNIINFTRIKDELKNGVSLKEANEKGNKNSIGTIIDANVTTLIVAVILFIFGESSIKGFATMLMISIFATMFIMVILTRILLNKIVKTGYFDNKTNAFIGAKNSLRVVEKTKKFDFVKNNKFYLMIVGLILVLGFVSIYFKGFKLSVEFKGGTSISINSENKINVSDVKQEIESMGYTVYDEEIISDNQIDLKVNESILESEIVNTQEKLVDKFDASVDINTVSNIVKRELIKNAIKSVIIAIIGIIIYISLRLSFSFAISAIIALVHDVLITIIVFSIFKLEVSTLFIAAILSIIGYSINDTIVTFDRIKEVKNNKKNIKKKEELKEIINDSIKSTLTRNILTSITTLIPIICLIIFGSHEIFNFNIAMLSGLIAGSCSSLFLATAIYYLLEKKNVGKLKKKKWYEE